MIRTAATISVSLSLATVACGGGGGGGPDAAPDAPPSARCEPTPPALPTEGPLIDPLALPLPAACVVGGLRDLPGRWFVRDPASDFSYQYPKFDGDCAAGFRRANTRPDDLDSTGDGQTYHQWSDGTRVFTRAYYRFPETGDPLFEYASVFAACVLPDDTLAVVSGYYDTDFGEETTAFAGVRFGMKDGPATGLHLVGQLDETPGGEPIVAYNVVVDGTHAYTVGPLGLDVIDVTDPAAPVHLSHVDGAFNDVRVTRGAGRVVAFVSPLYNEGTYVIDVTDPAVPELQSQIPEYSHSVFVRDEGGQLLLYLATYTEVVPVFDVTNPLTPIRLGQATVPGEIAGVHDLFADGTMIYANNTTAGLVAFDVSAGLDTAVERGRILTSYSHASFAGTAGGRPLVLHGDEGMTPADGGAFLRVLEGDLASGTFATELGRYQSRPEVGIHNFVLVGDKVYIAYYQDGVRVVDVSNAAQPTEVAHYNTWDVETSPGAPFEGALGIRVVGGLIYVADSLKGLVILAED